MKFRCEGNSMLSGVVEAIAEFEKKYPEKGKVFLTLQQITTIADFEKIHPGLGFVALLVIQSPNFECVPLFEKIIDAMEKVERAYPEHGKIRLNIEHLKMIVEFEIRYPGQAEIAFNLFLLAKISRKIDDIISTASMQ